jgi:hypothetical protein
MELQSTNDYFAVFGGADNIQRHRTRHLSTSTHSQSTSKPEHELPETVDANPGEEEASEGRKLFEIEPASTVKNDLVELANSAPNTLEGDNNKKNLKVLKFYCVDNWMKWTALSNIDMFIESGLEQCHRTNSTSEGWHRWLKSVDGRMRHLVQLLNRLYDLEAQQISTQTKEGKT